MHLKVGVDSRNTCVEGLDAKTLVKKICFPQNRFSEIGSGQGFGYRNDGSGRKRIKLCDVEERVGSKVYREISFSSKPILEVDLWGRNSIAGGR